MTTIPIARVRGELPALLERVQAGEVVVISRHGRPVARLVAEHSCRSTAVAAAWVDRLRDWHGLAGRLSQVQWLERHAEDVSTWETNWQINNQASSQTSSQASRHTNRRSYDDRERWGRQGYLLDASVITALLVRGTRTPAALHWLEQVGDTSLAVSAGSVLDLEAGLAMARLAHHATQPSLHPSSRPSSSRPSPAPESPEPESAPRQSAPRSWLEEPVPPWPAQAELVEGFLAERCPVAYLDPADYQAARLRQRHRPGLAAWPQLLEFELAQRTGLMPVTFRPQVRWAAERLRYRALVLQGS